MAIPQEQCPILCQLCEVDVRVKWKCQNCDLLLCTKCKDTVHSKIKTERAHTIIIINQVVKQTEEVSSNFDPQKQEGQAVMQSFGDQPNVPPKVTITNVTKYNTRHKGRINKLAISSDNSLWIAQLGNLEKVKIQGQKLEVRCSFSCSSDAIIGSLFDITITNSNDLLLSTQDDKIKQIRCKRFLGKVVGTSNEIVDTDYYVESAKLMHVHATKDDKVIVSGRESYPGKKTFIMVMDRSCKIHYKLVGSYTSITSTSNGNIFVLEVNGDKKVSVMVLGKTGVIWYYKGHPSVNNDKSPFDPRELVTTPLDNVIVADCSNHTLHVLNNTGNLLTLINTKDIGIECPYSLACTTEGELSVLYVGCNSWLTKTMEHNLFKINITI